MRQGGAVGHSYTVSNPSGGAGVRREPMQPTLHDDLMARVMAPANLRRAWKRVKANRGAPGVDGMTVDDFPVFAREHWPDIRRALLDGSYQPSPVRRVEIPKPKGRGVRLLGIPSVTDRIIQQAIAQVLTPLFDCGFSESSFGFRPGRCAHGALRQVQRHIRAGYCIAVDLDLERFFDRVQHDVLLERVGRKVRDKRLLALIARYLRAGVLVGDIIQASEMGTPPGRSTFAVALQCDIGRPRCGTGTTRTSVRTLCRRSRDLRAQCARRRSRQDQYHAVPDHKAQARGQ